MNTVECHEYRGMLWIPWNAMNTVEYHEYHGIIRIPWNDVNTRDACHGRGAPLGSPLGFLRLVAQICERTTSAARSTNSSLR